MIPHWTFTRSCLLEMQDYFQQNFRGEGWATLNRDKIKDTLLLLRSDDGTWTAHVWYNYDPRDELHRLLRLSNAL